MSFTQIKDRNVPVVFTGSLKVFLSAWLSGTYEFTRRCKDHKLSENHLLVWSFSFFLTAIKWLLHGRVFYISSKSLSLCPIQSFMILGMFPIRPHLSVLVWQRGPASSHSCPTASSLTSDCCFLHIKTMPCQSELVCPSPWVEPCHYFAKTQVKKVWFSTR